MFWENFSPRGQETQKRGQTMNEVTQHNLLFLGICPSPNFLKLHDVSAPNLMMDPFD
jgi:hypothetical protein